MEAEHRPAVGLYREVGFVVTDAEGAELETALTMERPAVTRVPARQ